MEFKDYYGILGVSPDADIKEIKKSYQTLAKKYHPDVNPGDSEAEKKFKEINEAYHAIADPAKRQKYDDLRKNYQAWQSRGGRGTFDWSPWQESGGYYSRTMTPEEFAEMFGGSTRGFGGFSDFFSTIFGMGSMGEYENDDIFSGMAHKGRRGRDIEGEISVSLEEVYHGSKRLLEIDNKRIETVIPKGIRDNGRIRLAGQGEAGPKGGKPGDLYLNVKVKPHPRFIRNGNDLTINLEIDFYTAVLGGEARIETLAGEVILKIPPRTKAGKSFRLKGKGMPILNQAGKYGDLYAKVVIVLPEKLTEKEINTLQELQKFRSAKEE